MSMLVGNGFPIKKRLKSDNVIDIPSWQIFLILFGFRKTYIFSHLRYQKIVNPGFLIVKKTSRQPDLDVFLMEIQEILLTL
jgi:hypothetical protein